MEIEYDITQEQALNMADPFETDLLYLFRMLLADVMEELDEANEEVTGEAFINKLEELLG